MISIITPTYNEAKNIKELIIEISKAMKNIPYEIIVSDDNSPDGTAKIAFQLSKKYPVRTLIRKRNKGLSPAVCDGFKIAKGDIIAVIDADLSHPPEIIPKMIKAMKEKDSDIVVASRLIKGGNIKNWPFKRKLISFIATSLTKPITKVKDPMSGFFIFRKDVIKGAKLKTKGYKILLEILGKGNYRKVTEYPFTFKDRVAGKSKLNLRTELQYLIQVMDLFIYSLTNKKKIIYVK